MRAVTIAKLPPPRTTFAELLETTGDRTSPFDSLAGMLPKKTSLRPTSKSVNSQIGLSYTISNDF